MKEPARPGDSIARNQTAVDLFFVCVAAERALSLVIQRHGKNVPGGTVTALYGLRRALAGARDEEVVS